MQFLSSFEFFCRYTGTCCVIESLFLQTPRRDIGFTTFMVFLPRVCVCKKARGRPLTKKVREVECCQVRAGGTSVPEHD